jgi:hypothetical protein
MKMPILCVRRCAHLDMFNGIQTEWSLGIPNLLPPCYQVKPSQEYSARSHFIRFFGFSLG